MAEYAARIAEAADLPPAALPCDLTVLILTHNETRHIARAIASIRRIARDVVVIDSFSTDDTVVLAETAGARVLQHRFVNYARQFQWGLDHGGIVTEWVLRLDADEIIETDLAQEIAERLPMLPADVAGVNFARKHIFMGRWIRHGGRYPLILLRLWRTRQGRIEDRWMDEHIVVSGGRTIDFAGGFADVCEYDLTFFTDKHNRYATREAIDVLNQKYALFGTDRALTARSASVQAGMKRWVKERFYNRLPFWAGPAGYFLYRYILQLGFLDRSEGLIYHFLQGFWYRFLVGAKIVEYDRQLALCANAAERRILLSRLTGHDLCAAGSIDPSGREPRGA